LSNFFLNTAVAAAHGTGILAKVKSLNEHLLGAPSTCTSWDSSSNKPTLSLGLWIIPQLFLRMRLPGFPASEPPGHLIHRIMTQTFSLDNSQTQEICETMV
jgi:hypothetical protein